MDHYKDSNGNTVFTSAYFKKRGSCCKSACLHCPYVFTLNKHGIKFTSFESNQELVSKIHQEFSNDSVTSSLLAGAFGKAPSLKLEDAQVMTLKDHICGIAYIKDGKLIDFKLREHFSDQGITRAYLEGVV